MAPRRRARSGTTGDQLFRHVALFERVPVSGQSLGRLAAPSNPVAPPNDRDELTRDLPGRIDSPRKRGADAQRSRLLAFGERGGSEDAIRR
jgi:hypothetical protein